MELKAYFTMCSTAGGQALPKSQAFGEKNNNKKWLCQGN